MNEFCPESPRFIPQCVTNTLSKLRHRVAYQNEETHEISSKPIPLIAELCPLRYAFEMMFVTQANYNLWEIEYTQIEEHRKELRNELNQAKQSLIQASTKEEKEIAEKRYSQLSNHIRLVNNAVLLLNSAADSSDEAKDVLRLSRKAALTHNEELLKEIESRFDGTGHAVESYFTNQKIMELREGVNLARKDNRISENRGFFLAPRQARTFSGMDHRTEEGSVSTLARNTFYLFIMGLCPILVAAWRLRRICRSG